MNNKGYIAPATMLIILLVSLMFFGLFYTRTIAVSGDMSASSKLVDGMNKNNSGVERAHALLSKNVSYEGVVNYEDIEKKYEVSTINEQYETILLNSNSNSLKFNIKNKTPIEIKLTVFPIDSEFSHSYSAELIHNGKNLLTESQNIYYDFQQIIDPDKIYNKKTQEVNYGDYFLNITQVDNCFVKIDVNYDILRKREVLLKGDSIEKSVIITNDDKLTVEFKKGGK